MLMNKPTHIDSPDDRLFMVSPPEEVQPVICRGAQVLVDFVGVKSYFCRLLKQNCGHKPEVMDKCHYFAAPKPTPKKKVAANPFHI